MQGFSSKDIKAFNQAVLELHSTQNADEFSWQIHKALRAIMSGDISVVDWVDPRTSLSLACRYFPDHVISEELSALGHVLLPLQSPMWLKCGDEPRAVSECLSRTTWARRDLCWALRDISQEEFLSSEIRISSSLLLMVANMRSSYGTHTAAERLKLKLLGPHLLQVYRRLAAQGEVMVGRELVRRQTGVHVNAAGRTSDWPAELRELLAAYGLSVVCDELPDTIRTWFLKQSRAVEPSSGVSKSPKPLRLERAGHSLRIYRKRHRNRRTWHLIFREIETASAHQNPLARLGVSAREREVLLWLTQGKTNGEIAGILGVSSGTVRRHLENIFPKLGVENRHSAALAVTQAQARQDMLR